MSALFDPRLLAAAYRGMIPWMLLLWGLALLLPGPTARQALLTIGASPFFLASASRALGIHHGWSSLALAVDRAFSHLTSLLVLVVLTALAAAVGGTLGAIAADLAGLPDDRPLSIPGAALATLPLLWSRWPAAVLAFAVPEAAGTRGPRGRAWRGPGYGDARRISRLAGSARRTTLILATFFLWALVLILLGGPGTRPVEARAVEGLSFLALLPLLSAMALVEVRRMLEVLDLEGGNLY